MILIINTLIYSYICNILKPKKSIHEKLSLLTGLIVCLLLFTQAKAQNEGVTSKTATKAKGYTVLNKEGPVTLFKFENNSKPPKGADKYAPKYFFTTASSDVLQPLTKDNVKKAFPENHPFHDAIDATFKSDDDLSQYDTFHKMYKVNRLLAAHH